MSPPPGPHRTRRHRGCGCGNDLGTLLGYQFERDLHEAYDLAQVRLDEFIAPLRAAFPSAAPVDQSVVTETEQRLVVDGLSLLTTIRDNTPAGSGASTGTLLSRLSANGYDPYPYGLAPALLPGRARPRRWTPFSRRWTVADTVDAVGDLLLTEGVYQIAQGNHPRAAAALSALGQGRVPPRPEVVDTPLTGARVTHRVLLQLSPFDRRAISPVLAQGATLSAAVTAALPALWSICR